MTCRTAISIFVLSFGSLWTGIVHSADNNGYFKLQTLFQGPGKCFEGNKFAPTSTLGGAAFMDNCQNVSGQLWKIVPAQNGYFKFQTLFQGPDKCLEGNKFAPSSTLGGAAFMDSCQNVSGQLWKIVPAHNGYFKLQTLFQGADNCLEGNNFAPTSTLGGAAFMDNCQNVSGQLWKITGQTFNVSPNLPHDVTSATTPYPTVSLTDLAKFAWQEFVALNYPADPNHRGRPSFPNGPRRRVAPVEEGATPLFVGLIR